jgi:Luciferase-like monooxygenase
VATRFGYFLSSEERTPQELVRQARLAEQAGFDALWISDHFHPWLDEQGQSSHVWSVIGAVSQVTSLPITTAVTCPLVRQHPARLVSEDMITAPCGPDPAVHLAGNRAYAEAGFDEVYVSQAGPETDGFFEFYATQVLPELRKG